MKTSRPRRIGLAALAVTAMLAVAACGSGTPSADDTTNPTTDATAPGGDVPTELRLSIQREPAGFDVASLTAGTDAFIWSSLYDRLVVQGEDGAPAPGAAESWEFSDDGLTLTFHLRDDLVFANGDPATAEHVAATLEHIRANPGPNQPTMGRVDTITAPDDTTVVVTFTEPDIGFMSQMVLTNGIIGHKDFLGDPDQSTNPVGSGPYTLNMDESVPGSSWVLERRDDHWNAEAYPFETVEISVIADPTAAENAMQSGQLDWLALRPASVASFEAGDYTLTKVEGTAIMTLRIMDREGELVPALADARVREAINLAINRQAFVDGPGQGFGKPTTQMFFPGTVAYDESLNDVWAYDLERAKELMAEAGYADGFDVTLPSIVFTQDNDPLVGQALANIGINVTWEPIPPADTTSAILSGRFPMVQWPEGSATPTRTVQGNYLPDSFVNPFGTTDPELDALLEEFNTTLDEQERNALAGDINRFLVENAWDAPIYLVTQTLATTPGITYLGTSTQTFSTLALFGVES